MSDHGPAARPCGSCPYRRDVPSGVWAEEEYAKLPPYDRATAYQPPGVFFCHQQDGRMCAGWVGCHDMDEALALRIACSVGVLSEEEYAKLPPYDCDTAFQPVGVFFCHQQDGRMCAGWVGCHDMDEALALRIACSVGVLSEEDVEAARAYECPVPLWASGAEAAAHGRAEIELPGSQARRTIDRLTRKLTPNEGG